MVRSFLLTLSLLLVASFTFAQTSLTGKVTDGETGEEMIGANIVVKKNGVFIQGESTDIDGNFSIRVDPGTYDVEVSYTGYATQAVAGVIASAGQATKVDVQLKIGGGVLVDEIVVTEYKIPLIKQDETTSGGTVTSEKIRQLPTRNINAVAAATAGASTSDEGEAVTIKGSRSNATDYYIDGIRVSGNLLPESEIEQMQVITGGISARYGDVTGGIISITTKGPSAKFAGGVEAETSKFLDAFGQSLVGANLSGPILKKKNEDGTSTSILGFRFSGRYTYNEDNSPTATGVYVVKPEKLKELQENPLAGSFGTPSGQFLTADDVELLDARPNESLRRFNGTLKLDARVSDAIDLSFTGTYATGKDYFTPRNGSRTTNWMTFNSQNNPHDMFNRYRGIFRFRHRLGGGNAEGETKNSVVSNFEYTIQGGYEYNDFVRQDSRHEDRFFDYGYIGKIFKEAVPNIDVDNGIGTHIGFNEQITGFELNREINPILANYNNGIVDIDEESDLWAQNGSVRGSSASIYTFHTNVGTVFNQYRKDQGSLITAMVNSSFDLHPGGTDKGRHSIQVGLLYEQREQRQYILSPRRLWDFADFYDNEGINERSIDSMTLLGTEIIASGDTVDIFQTVLNLNESSTFYRAIRDVQGLSVNEFANVDELTPDQLSLDMFAPNELTDFALARYYGYDHTGGRIGSDVTFDDFFSATTTTQYGNTIRAFPVAPFRPNYTAAYIQDKFTYKDIIFRVGVRVDRYDANTKVLKDPFSLYDIKDAQQFFSEADNADQFRPNTIGDDFKVYVNGPDDNTVKAFRDGEQWYFADGTAANGGNVIFGASGVPTAQFSNPNAGPNWIKDASYDPNDGFEDYKPQINVMPRLAFSFPISDVANFFAHYDILVQRPPDNNIATALDYYYFGDVGRTTERNPNLKPERTIDYEVGFQQKLTNSSALKVSAYYKEMRDMIQIRDFLYLPLGLNINQYTGFDNLDFGTVKGFTFQYDLRRTKNITLLAAYTLQFADGTGSNAESSRNLSQRGNIRNLFPLSFDERHRFNISLDYRYASGRKYNGPVLFGKDILANAGANVQVIAVSGRPYTATSLPDQFGGDGTVGSLNGARLPWNFTVNLRVDKSFRLFTPQENTKSPIDLNVYVRVQNLLDRRNLLGVYTASGSPDDDGFLTSPNGRSSISSLPNGGEDFFLPSYSWALLNPGFFTLPRRIYIGAILEF